MQHYPRTLIGQVVSEWCNVCNGYTPHRIDAVTVDKKAGRLGPCLNNHTDTLTKAQRTRRQKQRQGNLFE